MREWSIITINSHPATPIPIHSLLSTSKDSWMVYSGKSHLEMDDLGVAPLMEIPICRLWIFTIMDISGTVSQLSYKKMAMFTRLRWETNNGWWNTIQPPKGRRKVNSYSKIVVNVTLSTSWGCFRTLEAPWISVQLYDELVDSLKIIAWKITWCISESSIKQETYKKIVFLQKKHI